MRCRVSIQELTPLGKEWGLRQVGCLDAPPPKHDPHPIPDHFWLLGTCLVTRPPPSSIAGLVLSLVGLGTPRVPLKASHHSPAFVFVEEVSVEETRCFLSWAPPPLPTFFPTVGGHNQIPYPQSNQTLTKMWGGGGVHP